MLNCINSTFAATIAAAATADEPSIAYSGRLFGDGGSVRLIIDFDAKTLDKIQYLKGPDRIVLEFENSTLNFIEPKLIKARGLVGKLRYGTTGNGNSRLVLTLNSSAKILSRESVLLDNDAYRLIYDIAVIEQKEFEALLFKADPFTKSDGGGARNEKITEKPIVIIDPGHGGVDGGAQGANGIVEKNVTLAFAKRLKNVLEQTGIIQVILTRDDDRFLSLKKRVKYVKSHQARLFISIHADSLKQKSVRGATVYTLSQKASDKLAKNLADAENRADLVGGNSSATEFEGAVVNILAELAMRETKKYSHRFAKNTVKLLRQEIQLIKNPHRFAAFGVLKDPNTPSILLELGYLSNDADAKLLQSDVWHSKFSKVLAKAIVNFFEKQN